MDRVRGKFYVSSITRRAHNRDQAEVELSAVSRGEENKAWSAATPFGSIKLGILNEAAAAVFREAFDAGREFYVDFAVVPENEHPAA